MSSSRLLSSGRAPVRSRGPFGTPSSESCSECSAGSASGRASSQAGKLASLRWMMRAPTHSSRGSVHAPPSHGATRGMLSSSVPPTARMECSSDTSRTLALERSLYLSKCFASAGIFAASASISTLPSAPPIRKASKSTRPLAARNAAYCGPDSSRIETLEVTSPCTSLCASLPSTSNTPRCASVDRHVGSASERCSAARVPMYMLRGSLSRRAPSLDRAHDSAWFRMLRSTLR